MSREYTQREVQDMFLGALWGMIRYWTKVPDHSDQQKLQGLTHSFLTLLDGHTMSGLPACTIIPVPHPSDKAYFVEEDENYHRPFDVPEDIITIEGNDLLHEQFYTYGKRCGYVDEKGEPK